MKEEPKEENEIYNPRDTPVGTTLTTTNKKTINYFDNLFNIFYLCLRITQVKLKGLLGKDLI